MPDSAAVEILNTGSKLLSSPVTTYKGSIEAIAKLIPKFERRTFGPSLLPIEPEDNLFSTARPGGLPGYNSYYDAIVRQPVSKGDVEVPVGIVSKQYTLVQHQIILEEALKSIKELRISPSEVKAELDLTCYGERMRLGLLFPEKYNLKLNDHETMGLRLECFNSVDGSMKFMAVIGWLRFVCANGMVIGVADSYYRRRHNKYMEIQDIAAVLRDGIASATKEREVYKKWMNKMVPDASLEKWVDGFLAKRWGVKAAARTWHITRYGKDVTFADPFEKGAPTQKTVLMGDDVPGAVLPGNNVYAVSQALSWLAKERTDVQEQLEWKQQIPDLVQPLLGRRA